MRKKLAVLGATGSVGMQTIDVVRSNKDLMEIVCISADKNWRQAVKIANEFKPEYIIIGNAEYCDSIFSSLTYNAKVLPGFENSVSAIAESSADFVVIATSGMAGLRVFDYCLENGINVGLANKETLVCGGKLIMSKMHHSVARVYPIDSEHMALFQCLGNHYDVKNISRLILTASGGPFLGYSKGDLLGVTVAQAVAHPKWNMGYKISVDSATLANKGQEVIEASFLYNTDADDIDVVIHPQSLVHSMVEFSDCSILAQIAPTDMRIPIQKAICECNIIENINFSHVDFVAERTMDFFKPDTDTFRCLGLAYQSLKTEDASTIVYSVADEIAVNLFVNGSIGFLDIAVFIEKALNRFSGRHVGSIDEIFDFAEEINIECGNN